MATYQITLESPLGQRSGQLTLRGGNGLVAGTLSLLGFENPGGGNTGGAASAAAPPAAYQGEPLGLRNGPAGRRRRPGRNGAGGTNLYADMWNSAA